MKKIFLIPMLLSICILLFACSDNGDITSTTSPIDNNDTDEPKVTTITEEEWEATFAEDNYTLTIDDSSARELFELLGVEYTPSTAKYTKDVICFCGGIGTGFIGENTVPFLPPTDSSTTTSTTTSSTRSSTGGMPRSMTSLTDLSAYIEVKSGTGCAVKFEGQWYYFLKSERYNEEAEFIDIWKPLDNPYSIPCSFSELSYDEVQQAYCFYDTEKNQKSFYYFENGILVKDVIIVGRENEDLTNITPNDTTSYIKTRTYSNRGSTVITETHNFSIDMVEQ